MMSEVEAGQPSVQQQQDPNHKVFSSQIEDEVAGINERGVRAPQVRIPGKTHLSAVLLIANPWEKRDLDRKLTKIKRERIQKERNLEWNQRQFFINQIFDQDLNLRFNKLLMEDKNRQKAGEGPIEFTQYYHGRDDVAQSSINGLVKREEDGLLYCPIPAASRRPSTYNANTSYPDTHRSSIGNISVQRSAEDENLKEVVTDRSDNIGSGNSRGSSRRASPRKLEKKLSTASMGIFAPPLNPKPKTKYQRDKLLKKHSPTVMKNGINIEEDVEEDTTNAVNESKDISITTNDTNNEANVKLTLPVLVAAKDKISAEVCSDDHSEISAKSDDVKDKTYLTTAEPREGKSDKKSEDVTEIQISELPKPRYDFDKAYSVILPDIRINNYTVPSPIQEEDEERRSSAMTEEETTDNSLSKNLHNPTKHKLKNERKERNELRLNLPKDMLRSEPATPTLRSFIGTPSMSPRPVTNRTSNDSFGFCREDTRLSSRLEGIGSDHDDQSEYNQSETSSTVSRHSSALLEGDVISRLTRTLPETLMIKANQNINKLIDKRKQRMLKKARDSSSRDIKQDPRWQKLESALSDKYTCE